MSPGRHRLREEPAATRDLTRTVTAIALRVLAAFGIAALVPNEPAPTAVVRSGPDSWHPQPSSAPILEADR